MKNIQTCVLKSSNIYRIGHYTQDDVLQAVDSSIMIAIMKGGNYAYLGVPVETFQAMCVAESAGKFHNAEIKNKFAFRKATDEEVKVVMEVKPIVIAPPPVAEVRVVQDLGGRVYPAFNNVGLVPVDVSILDPNVKIAYANPGDAAFDLMAASVSHPTGNYPLEFPVTVMPGDHVMIGTGLRIALHPGMAGFVMPRSGLAKKFRVSVVNTPGLIDSGYRNEVGVLFENRGDEPYIIKEYDRIAQFGIVPMLTPIFRMVADLDQTDRGMGGFGSSGVAQTEKSAV